MYIVAPSRLNNTPVGYQPVGMNPLTRLSPGRDTSTNATVLLSAFATSSRSPAGDSVTAFGVEPGGAFGNIAMEICSAALAAARSIVHTALVFAHATKRRWPSPDSTIAFGWPPTAISALTASVDAS